MKQYQDLIELTLDTGVLLPNRTGVEALSIPGAMMRFDVSETFPAVTTKKLAFKSVVGELCGFLRASRSAATFRKLGCKVWDANANQNQAWLGNLFRKGEDDLGPVYGSQWREWQGFKFFKDEEKSLGEIKQAESMGWEVIMNGPYQSEETPSPVLMYKEIDQLANCISTIINNPYDRRILFHGWNPAVLDEIALPACHLLYQFLPNPKSKELSLMMTIRSQDLFLGAPFNIAEATALLYLVARLTGYTPKWYIHSIGDCHLYVDSVLAAREQLTKEPMAPPTLVLDERIPQFSEELVAQFGGDKQAVVEHLIEWLHLVEPEDFVLKNYQHHVLEAAPVKMAV